MRITERSANGARLCCLPLGMVGFAVLTLAMGHACTANEKIEAVVSERPDWERVFRRNDGWTGGDACYAVALSGNRTLWLFADTWVGPVRDGRHVDARIVNNTLAMHDTPKLSTAPPPDAVKFFWGPADTQGFPRAWIVPEASRVHGQRPRNATDDPSWYWVADAIEAPGPEGKPRLLIFLWHMGRTRGEGVWNFASLGQALAIVERPELPIDEWRPVQFEIPHARGDAVREASPPGQPVTWGASLMLVPREKNAAVTAPWLYVFGTRSEGMGSELVLARVPSESVDDWNRWEFRTKTHWSSQLNEAHGLAAEMVSEFSISRVTGLPREQMYVMVQSEPWFGTRILLRHAPEPEGPWSKPAAIYQVPNIKPERKDFTYAAKAHPHLSEPGKLLVTYVVNSHDFWAMVGDAEIYRPRFIEIDLHRLPDAR